MNASRTLAIVLRQYYLLRHSPTRFIQLFIWAGVDMLLWGFMTRYLNGVTGQQGVNFVPALLGAVLLWDMLIRIMQGVSMAYMEDNWSRNLFNIFASPLSVGEYLAGLVLSSLMTSVVGVIVMLILAIGVFGLSLFSYGIAILPFLIILFMFGIALGIFGCGLMLRLGPSAEWFIWPIPAVISPFAAVYYPMATLPGWMQAVGKGIPPSYVFENIRAISAGHDASMAGLGAGIGLSAIYIALACLFFIAMHRRAVGSGAIARYTAESV
jgi:ABC-2 type transport system permease protein